MRLMVCQAALIEPFCLRAFVIRRFSYRSLPTSSLSHTSYYSPLYILYYNIHFTKLLICRPPPLPRQSDPASPHRVGNRAITGSCSRPPAPPEGLSLSTIPPPPLTPAAIFLTTEFLNFNRFSFLLIFPPSDLYLLTRQSE